MPLARCQALPNTGRAYQSPPRAKYATAATITASQFRSPRTSNDMPSSPRPVRPTVPAGWQSSKHRFLWIPGTCLLCWSIPPPPVRRYGERGDRRRRGRGGPDEVRAADLHAGGGARPGGPRGRRKNVRGLRPVRSGVRGPDRGRRGAGGDPLGHHGAVQGGPNGDVVTTDGPFAETKEQLAGFYVIEAADLDEAIQVAARVPSATFGSIEIRPVAPGPQGR